MIDRPAAGQIGAEDRLDDLYMLVDNAEAAAVRLIAERRCSSQQCFVPTRSRVEGVNKLEKMRLGFAGGWPLRGVMSATDDTTRHEIVRRLFCLITTAAEDAAVLTVEGQTKGMPLDDATASADNLRELGARIECLSAAIVEVVTEVGNEGVAV